jgi:hypothetical protein
MRALRDRRLPSNHFLAQTVCWGAADHASAEPTVTQQPNPPTIRLLSHRPELPRSVRAHADERARASIGARPYWAPARPRERLRGTRDGTAPLSRRPPLREEEGPERQSAASHGCAHSPPLHKRSLSACPQTSLTTAQCRTVPARSRRCRSRAPRRRRTVRPRHRQPSWSKNLVPFGHLPSSGEPPLNPSLPLDVGWRSRLLGPCALSCRVECGRRPDDVLRFGRRGNHFAGHCGSSIRRGGELVTERPDETVHRSPLLISTSARTTVGVRQLGQASGTRLDATSGVSSRCVEHTAARVTRP